jgi:hypothetical protein
MIIMKIEKAYPELLEYIYNYCGKYFWRKANLNSIKFDTLIIESAAANILMYKVLTEGGRILSDVNLSELTNDGYDAYKIRIATRIFDEYKDELELNLCPKCNKIARTPEAKQCRFCSHSWRESEIC